MDLTPRTLTDTQTGATTDPATGVVTPRRTRRRRRRWTAPVSLALLLIAAAVVLFQGLSSASLYFCNADEVGVRTECMPTKRFRLQGMVDQGSVKKSATGTDFTVTFGTVPRTIAVHYDGEPGGIFQEGIPVVAEGRLDGAVFDATRILVKHSESYIAKNPGRVPAGAP